MAYQCLLKNELLGAGIEDLKVNLANGLILVVCYAGLSTRACSWPKPPASQLSLAGYFRLILPVLLMKNLKNTIVEACKASVSQF